MPDSTDLISRIKNMMVEHLMLPYPSEEIDNDTPLFSPEGLGLDSVDALQLVVALDKDFGLKIDDQEVARKTLHNVNSMVAAVQRHQETTTSE